jgi:hypothetical protein
MSGAMGSHQSAAMLSDIWLTPPAIVEALGPFDLDPCSPIGRPWDTAAKHYTIDDDGLAQQWDGYTWVNPPYGKEAATWLDRLADHGDGIALVFARTETRMFFDHVWPRADALLFIEGRLHFHRPDGTRAKANSGAPSVLIAYGSRAARRLVNSSIAGARVWLNSRISDDTDRNRA